VDAQIPGSATHSVPKMLGDPCGEDTSRFLIAQDGRSSDPGPTIHSELEDSR